MNYQEITNPLLLFLDELESQEIYVNSQDVPVLSIVLEQQENEERLSYFAGASFKSFSELFFQVHSFLTPLPNTIKSLDRELDELDARFIHKVSDPIEDYAIGKSDILFCRKLVQRAAKEFKACPLRQLSIIYGRLKDIYLEVKYTDQQKAVMRTWLVEDFVKYASGRNCMKSAKALTIARTYLPDLKHINCEHSESKTRKKK